MSHMSSVDRSQDPTFMELLHSSKVRQRNVNKPIEEIIVHGREGYEDIKEDNGRKGSQRRIALG